MQIFYFNLIAIKNILNFYIFSGMCTGWLLHRIQNRLILPAWAVVLGWTCSLAIMWSLVYGMLYGSLSVAATAAYVSIGHTGKFSFKMITLNLF